MQRALCIPTTKRLHFSKSAPLCPIAAHNRLYQTQFAPNMKVSLIDSISLVYEDPSYHLTLRPFEYRDRQYSSYTSFGAMAATLPCLGAIFIMFFSWAWYTFNDREVSRGWVHNFHPFFDVHTATDIRRHPIFHPTLMVSPIRFNTDREFFYQEIEQAIQSRKAEKKLMMQ